MKEKGKNQNPRDLDAAHPPLSVISHHLPIPNHKDKEAIIMKTFFLFHRRYILGCAALIIAAGSKTQSQAQAPSPMQSSVPLLILTHSAVPSRGRASLLFTAHSELIDIAAIRGSSVAATVTGTESKSGKAEALTAEPSSKASPSPSVIPSPTPSSKPSFSFSPSATPSNKASATPSTMPSSKPTSKPSSNPSATPSNRPSPSVIPSSKPSATPSTIPSSKPTSKSSLRPSATPSNQPLATSSTMPSNNLTSKPSFSLSVTPRSKPSPNPSMKASSTLSSKPSSSPCATPSSKPSPTRSETSSSKPSPSSMPSSKPSSNTSFIPSASAMPSSNPSPTPTPTPGPDPSRDGPVDTGTDSGFLKGKTFVQKIYSLLTMTKYSSIISWNDAGTAVIIHDVDAFISTVVPAHFKKTKFGSFIRKMRRWGFSVFTRQRSTSISSTSSERGQTTIVEFSSVHFLRDQPELCLLMKDERNVKKQSSFLNRNTKQASDGGQNITQGSADGVRGQSPTSPSSSNMSATNYQSESQQQSEVPSFAMMPNRNSTGIDPGRLNATMNIGYAHNYSQYNSIPPMISPHQQRRQSYYDTMPVMNMTIPRPPPPPIQHPYYGYGYDYGHEYSYGAPPLPHQAATGVSFGPPSPQFQYPAPDGYAPYPHHHQQHHHHQQSPQQQQQQVMMQQHPQQHPLPQQQMMMQQYHPQHQQRQQYRHHPAPPGDYAYQAAASSSRDLATDFATSINPNECSEARASTSTATATANSTAVLLTSSEESTERLPNINNNMRQMR